MKRKKKIDSEEMPLMPQKPSRFGQTLPWRRSLSDEELDDKDDLQWLKIVTGSRKQTKGNSLLAIDAVLLLVNYVQLYAVIQSLSIRWPWPESWLSSTKYVFLLNVDIWEFLKLYEDGIFKYIQNYYFPSADIDVDYMHLTIAWGGLLFLFMVIYIAFYSSFSRLRSPKMVFRLAVLKKVLIVIMQIIAIPVGIFLCRLFHCNSADFVDVKNELYCFSGIHWAYIGPSLVVLFLIFILFPAWLIVRTKNELIKMTPEKHESYLQLKEMEYIHGLDITWVVGNFHIFAPFKNPAAHFRAAHMLIWATVLIAYAGLFKLPFAQAVALNSIFFVMFLACCFLQPFRLKAYNAMLIINYLCLTINCLTGCFKTSYDFSSIQSPWLLPKYQFLILVIVNSFWLFCGLVFVLYLIARTCCCQPRQDALWPIARFERLSAETRKYMRSIIIARLLVEKTLSIPAMFSPIHEVARYIHIINAYCREAEQFRDPLQSMLWDVLDELIEVHTNIAPKCLFAESTKGTIRRTATEFMDIMPMFVRHLAQREYDFILIPPVKRRIILKLYCLSLFLKGSKVRQDRRKLTVPAIQKIWHKQSDEESDPGYYEDMYPPKEPIVPHRVYDYDADVLIQLEDELSDDNDSFLIEETEDWLKKHGIRGNEDSGDEAHGDEDHGDEACGDEARGDALDDWMGEMGVGVDRSDDVISDLMLPRDFTIPGLTYTEDSLWGSDGQSVGPSRPTSALTDLGRLGDLPGTASRPASVLSTHNAKSLNLQPLTKRPSSAMSTATLVNSRPGSNTPRSSGSHSEFRPGSAAPLDLLSVDESLPGAIITEEDLKPSLKSPRNLKPEDTSSQTPRPNSVSSNMSQGKPRSSHDRPGSSHDRPGSSHDRPGSSHDRPGSSHDRQSSSHDRPGSSHDRPGSSTKPSIPESVQAADSRIDIDPDEDILV